MREIERVVTVLVSTSLICRRRDTETSPGQFRKLFGFVLGIAPASPAGQPPAKTSAQANTRPRTQPRDHRTEYSCFVRDAGSSAAARSLLLFGLLCFARPFHALAPTLPLGFALTSSLGLGFALAAASSRRMQSPRTQERQARRRRDRSAAQAASSTHRLRIPPDAPAAGVHHRRCEHRRYPSHIVIVGDRAEKRVRRTRHGPPRSYQATDIPATRPEEIRLTQP